ncbi:MAG: hypothetical protein ACOX0K_10500 [Oscillospiraceae bacterium]|jgi:hypothetical protein
MKTLTKVLALVLAVMLLWSGMTVPALAAPSQTYSLSDLEQNNREVEELAEALEEKYGITILYPTETGENSRQLATIVPETLRTLDEALDTVTPRLVRKVSAYYYELNKRRLTFEYVYADMRGPYSEKPQPEVQVGGFNRHTSRIRLYIPFWEEQGVATGDNPLTILHEFGHAFHFMLTDRYGYISMERRWLGLMEGNFFAPESVDKKVFITEYAATQYDEDFAETFAHAFACNRAGLGISHRLSRKMGRTTVTTPLGKKVAYIERLLKITMPDNLEMLDNFRLVYSTPTSTTAAGLRLSGPHLIFINMPEPRLVPLTLLNNLLVDEKSTVWFPSLGGWYCKDVYGNHLVLFPEGTYGNPGRDLMEYKEELDAKLAEDLAYAQLLKKEREEERARQAAQLQRHSPMEEEKETEQLPEPKDGGTLLRASTSAA